MKFLIFSFYFFFFFQEYYPYVISAIQFFLLAAFSMQLCLGLTVYMEFIEMKGVRYPELKLATMGWGKCILYAYTFILCMLFYFFHIILFMYRVKICCASYIWRYEREIAHVRMLLIHKFRNHIWRFYLPKISNLSFYYNCLLF